MRERYFRFVSSKIASVLVATILVGVFLWASPVAYAARPNIVFILADDLGYGDLSCYGQQKFKTPNIDRLAAEGMKFTAHYSGNNVCAPARCVLMSGKHPGHAYIRDNRGGLGPEGEGQEPVPAGELKLPLTLKKLGYTLGGFGKWGLGPVGSTGDPNKQGFDVFFGYNCQAVAHNYYPTHLWSNDTHIALSNPKFSARQKLSPDADTNAPASYAKFSAKDYAPDLIGEHALQFVRDNQIRPFFLYYPTTVPHLALQVPEDSLKEFEGKYPETPYPGGRGYLPHRTPRAAYAAMITRMDREVGRVLHGLEKAGAAEDTIVLYWSDHGDVLGSHGPLRGKTVPYAPAFRVPAILRWPGRLAARRTDALFGTPDIPATLLDLAGIEVPLSWQGRSFAPHCRGEAQDLPDAVPLGLKDWQAVWDGRYLYSEGKPHCLYDHVEDPFELDNRLADIRLVQAMQEKLRFVMRSTGHPEFVPMPS